jgi:hypothetical protein
MKWILRMLVPMAASFAWRKYQEKQEEKKRMRNRVRRRFSR